MLRDNFINQLEHICSKIENKNVKLLTYEKIYGGDINETYRLAMTERDYFIKINSKEKLKIFESEAKSLKILHSTHSFKIPKVFDVEKFEGISYLLMEFISPLYNVSNPKNFAESLSKLHRTTSKKYGLYFNNYIGFLPQYNKEKTSWTDFYIENRLQFQLNLLQQKGNISNEILNKFDKLYNKLPELLVEEKPSLLHGDLWNGNYFFDIYGKTVVFDPAIYYGNREVDLAMMSLFGGFDSKIYDIYNDIFPLEYNWKERIKIYQLYPLLVHFNLFGSSYLKPVKQILDYFVH